MEKNLFSERLKYALRLKNMTSSHLSELTGINKGTISHYISGRYRPKQDKIFIIAEALDINPQWLMMNSQRMEKQNKDIFKHNHHYSYIPAGISAGIPNEVDALDEFEKLDIPDIFLGRYAGQSDIIIMRVNGESMNRTIPDRSFIAVKTGLSIHDIHTGDIVVFSDSFNYSIKRYIHDKKGSMHIFRPESYDSVFEDIIFEYGNCENLQIIGKVVMYTVSL